MHVENLKGKAAIVTGGGTGIGREIAIELAKSGAKLVITGRRNDKLAETAKEIRKFSEVMHIKADIRKEEEVKKLFERAYERFKSIDLLINNAGGQFISQFEKISTNGFDAVVKTNLYGTWFCCREAVRYMKSNGGKILNVVHIYALRAAPGLAHSGAARAGVVNLTKTLALELAKYKINVNAIAPGVTVTTGFKEEMINNKKMMEELRDTIPLKRFADPKEVAELAVFLCSSSADFITGQVVAIDGGQILANWPDFTNL